MDGCEGKHRVLAFFFLPLGGGKRTERGGEREAGWWWWWGLLKATTSSSLDVGSEASGPEAVHVLRGEREIEKDGRRAAAVGLEMRRMFTDPGR